MNVGGPAVLLKELIENLPEEEFEHILITGRCLSNEIDYLEAAPLKSKVIYIDSLKRSVLLTSDLVSLVRLYFLLRRLRPDIVHTHTSKAGVLGRVAALMASPGAKIIHTFHGHLLYGYFGKTKLSLVVLVERVLAKFSATLVAVTHRVKEDLLARHIGNPVKWDVIPPGIHQPALIPTLEARRQIGLSANDFIVTWVGRFTEIKDPFLALQSFAELVADTATLVTLVMVGDGELLGSCKEFARDMKLPVIFAGWQTNIHPYLAAADLLLMTSKNEGMPVVIIESAFQKKMTVSTNVGGVGEFIVSNVSGILVNRNISEIGNALHDSLTNEDTLVRIGNAAYQIAMKSFTQISYLEKHLALYRKVLKP